MAVHTFSLSRARARLEASLIQVHGESEQVTVGSVNKKHMVMHIERPNVSQRPTSAAHAW